MFFGKLFARLGWLADFLPNSLPFVVLIFLDGIEKVLFLSLNGSVNSRQPCHHREGITYLVFSEFSVVHVLVPMLLHTAFCACGEFLLIVSNRFQVLFKTRLDSPWQFPPSCFRHPASASSGVLHSGSMECLSCSSSPAGSGSQ